MQLPLYYLVQSVLLSPFERAEVTAWHLRWPSTVFGVLAVLVTGLTGRRLFGARAGVAAAFVLAITPAAVHYGREARAYSLAILLVALATAATAAFVARPGVVRALLAGAACAALVLTHGVAPLVVGILLAAPPLVALARARGGGGRDELRTTLVRWMPAAGLAVAAWVAWTALASRQVADVGTIYSWVVPHWEEIFPWQPAASLAALSPGGPAPHRNVTRLFDASAWAGAAWLATCALLALRRGGSDERARRQRAAAGVLAAATLVTLGGLFAASVLVAPIHVVGRTDVLVLPWLALLAGAGASALRSRLATAAVLVVAAGLAVPGLVTELRSERRSVDAALADSVARHVGEGDVLVFAGSFQPTLAWHLPRRGVEVPLLGFPSSRDRQPQWVDWSRYEGEALRRDARHVARRALDEASARGGDAWVLYDSVAEHVPLLEELGALAPLELVERHPFEVGLFRASAEGWSQWTPSEPSSQSSATE